MRRTTALLGTVALALCVIMTVHSYSGAGLVGCAPGSSCDSVLGSRWSLVLGIIPVSALAFIVYAAFLFCLAYLKRAGEELKVLVWTILLALAGAIAGSAVYFISLQAVTIGQFCKYCMAAHCCGIMVAVLTLVMASREGLPGRRRLCAFAAGLLLAGLLAVFQALTVDDSKYVQGSADAALPALEGAGLPMIGEPDSDCIVKLMYDYQCPHCRKVHEAAMAIEAANRGRIAFVLCPTPLSPECNPYIPAGEDHFRGSCDYARLAMAIWHLVPEEFGQFDSWLWTNPPVEEARERAASLAGPSALAGILSSDIIFKDLANTCELFGRTSSGDRSGLPRMVCGQDWVIPEISSADELTVILNGSFGTVLTAPGAAE